MSMLPVSSILQYSLNPCRGTMPSRPYESFLGLHGPFRFIEALAPLRLQLSATAGLLLGVRIPDRAQHGNGSCIGSVVRLADAGWFERGARRSAPGFQDPEIDHRCMPPLVEGGSKLRIRFATRQAFRRGCAAVDACGFMTADEVRYIPPFELGPAGTLRAGKGRRTHFLYPRPHHRVSSGHAARRGRS
jgi:hypothetical protein